MEDIAKQLSLLNENFVRVSTRLDDIDARIDSQTGKITIIEGKIAIIEGKVESYDDQLHEGKEDNTNMEKKVSFNRFKSKRASYCHRASPDQASVVSSPTSIRNNRVGVSPIQPSGNSTSGETIELGEMKKSPAVRGMVVKSKSTKIVLSSRYQICLSSFHL